MVQANSDRDGAGESCCENSTNSAGLDARQTELGSDLATSRRFVVNGLDCFEEVRTLRRAVGPLVGGDKGLAFDAVNGRMSVLVPPSEATDHAIVSAVAATGMSAKPDTGSQGAESPAMDRGPLYSTIASGALLLLGIVLHLTSLDGGLSFAALAQGHGVAGPSGVEIAVWIGATLAGTRYVAPKAWYSLKSLRPDMNLLMVVAVVGALILGEWFEAATVAFLFALSLLLERWSVGRARRAVEALLDLTPATIHSLRDDGTELEIRATDADIGTRFIVRAGDRVALDGTVSDGAGSVDQAPITGESLPVLKEPGDEVFAGTINGEGTLTVRATKAASDTVLAKIIRMVGDAHARRAPVEQWVAKFARIYTPIVMALAIAIALLPPLLSGGAWDYWFYNALVLLVIACPCALVISTPVSIISAISNAAQNGVLIKGGVHLEALSGVKALALDKTGTLTEGKPSVVTVRSLACNETESCEPCDEMLALATAVEQRSEHPLAQAIIKESALRQVESRYPAASMVTALTGRGVTGSVNGLQIMIGSHPYFDSTIPHTTVHCDEANQDAQKGYTPMMVSADGEYLGTISVADTVRESSREAIQALKASGLASIVMLTGDNNGTAQSVGAQIGVTDVRSERLPEHKVAAVEALQQEYGPIAMVGDGINDAPALATANVGIAIGGALGGTSQAMETADITLMSDDLRQLPFAYELSQATMRTIRTNVALSIGIKLVFLGLVLIGAGTMWMAVLADVGTSLLVTGNGMRLLRRNGAL